MNKRRKDKCCICGQFIEGHGHNSYPVNSGRCCDKCNIDIVISRRKELIKVIKRGYV